MSRAEENGEHRRLDDVSDWQERRLGALLRLLAPAPAAWQRRAAAIPATLGRSEQPAPGAAPARPTPPETPVLTRPAGAGRDELPDSPAEALSRDADT